MTSEGLRIVDASKRYGDVQAVDGLTLAVPRGALVGFLGPNGAGKTTTMRAVLGMVDLDRGSITWDGTELGEATRARIGYMPQERGLYARMKVRSQVVYFGRLAGLTKQEAGDRADYWLERVGVADRAESLVQELSGGNQQRVQLAVSLVHDPELLILDEPFAGLDPVAAGTMRTIIAERAEAGASVLFSSHQLELVEGFCEQVVIIAAGRRVAAGDVDDLRAASPTRWLRVRWADRVAEWRPPQGTVTEFSGVGAVAALPATADIGATVAHALAAGTVTEISVEPPRLAEVFADVVEDPA